MERIPLANEHIEGDNNVYLFEGDPTVLVDTGEASERAREALASGLAAHGHTLADVDRVVLTHWHPDHSGLAAAVREASGASIHVHEADAPLARGDDDAWEAFLDRQQTLLKEWGVPETKREELFEHRAGDDVSERPDLDPVEPFADGDELDAGDATLEVLHTPGHTAGSACFAFDGDRGQEREVVAGDTLLPEYTPNVGGSDVRVERPLNAYLRSLDRVEGLDATRAWPGHRTPITDPRERIAAIRTHHERRAATMLDIVREQGPVTPWTVARETFGSLRAFHILVGAGEAFAHLDHLRAQGDLRLEGGRYALAPGKEDDASREAWPLESY